MSLYETPLTEPGLGRDDDAASFRSPEERSFARKTRSPGAAVPLPGGKKIEFHVDRVRARPAVSPTLSMNIGVTAIGLAAWGTLFPNHVKKTLGIEAPTEVVRALFGVREGITGFTLAADPTKAGMLWTRVVGDICDIAILRSLDNPNNPKRNNARAALGFVLFVTALDAITATRMSAVRRNCA